jgi:hypothetical protein
MPPSVHTLGKRAFQPRILSPATVAHRNCQPPADKNLASAQKPAKVRAVLGWWRKLQATTALAKPESWRD